MDWVRWHCVTNAKESNRVVITLNTACHRIPHKWWLNERMNEPQSKHICTRIINAWCAFILWSTFHSLIDKNKTLIWKMRGKSLSLALFLALALVLWFQFVREHVWHFKYHFALGLNGSTLHLINLPSIFLLLRSLHVRSLSLCVCWLKWISALFCISIPIESVKIVARFTPLAWTKKTTTTAVEATENTTTSFQP